MISLYHLKVGAAHARRRVLAIVDEHEATVVALDTGEIGGGAIPAPQAPLAHFFKAARGDA